MGGRQKGSKNKEPYRRKSNRGILLERAWRSIRIIRNGFTIPSLLATSSFGEESEKAAIRYLGIWLRRLVERSRFAAENNLKIVYISLICNL